MFLLKEMWRVTSKRCRLISTGCQQQTLNKGCLFYALEISVTVLFPPVKSNETSFSKGFLLTCMYIVFIYKSLNEEGCVFSASLLLFTLLVRLKIVFVFNNDIIFSNYSV